MLNQLAIENNLSRRLIRTKVRNDIDTTDEIFNKCTGMITGLFSGSYYKSKNNRLLKCTLTSEEIALELVIAVLLVKEIIPIQSVAASLGNRLGYSTLLDSIKTASEIIAVCEDSGLYTIYHSTDDNNDTDTLAIRANYKLSDDVEEAVRNSMYLPPMLCNPVKWTTNTDGGNLTGSGSIILGSINHHSKDQDLESINTIQSIAWELNKRMLQVEEVPNKVLDTVDKVKQFNVMKKESVKVYKSLINNGNKFYFVWKYDKRGRMYSQGYHVNLQSTEYKKSILQFSSKEMLT